MANAVIRAVVVETASTTRKQTSNSKQRKSETDTSSTFGTKTAHGLVDFQCPCICHTKQNISVAAASDAPRYRKNLKRKTNSSPTAKINNNTTPLNNETLDFPSSYTHSEEWSCLTCPRKCYKFHAVKTFAKLNISSSTAYKNTSSKEVFDAKHFHTPPKEHCANFRALGILQEKLSPIFGPTLNTPTKRVSLRSQNPFYTQRILQTEDLITSQSAKKFKENIDYTAIEAISMNGGRYLNNGPLGTFTKANSTGGFGTAAADINRNNGDQRNWVSFF